MTPFADRLAEAVRRAGNPLCVGLDPRWESLPAELCARYPTDSLDAVAAGIEVFCLRVLDLVAGRVGVVKPQSAFFEACGPAGLAALQVVIRRAQDLGSGGTRLYRHVGAAVAAWNASGLGACGLGDVGAVVGATHPKELAELRAELPNVWFLVPGYGAQGGSARDVAAAFRGDGLG